MRIAIIVGGLPPEVVGGTEIATDAIATHLGARGHEVVVFAPSEELQGPQPRNGYTAHFFPAEHSRFSKQLKVYEEALAAALPAYAPQIIQGHILSMSGILAVRLAKSVGAVSAVYARGSEDTGYTNEGTPLSRRRRRLMKEAGRQANATIVQTEYMKRAAAPYLGPDSHVIPNGIDVEAFPEASRAEMRAKLGCDPANPLVLSVANFHPTKNVRDAVAAFGNVVPKAPEARLVLIGDGRERAEIERQVARLDLSDSVDFLGRLAHEEVMEWMVASDLLVLLSEKEGFPNVLTEAFAAGLPVVVSDDGSHPEIVTRGVNGLLVPLHDHEAIAAAILTFLRDKALSERVGSANREVAREMTWERVVGKLEGVCTTLTDPPESG